MRHSISDTSTLILDRRSLSPERFSGRRVHREIVLRIGNTVAIGIELPTLRIARMTELVRRHVIETPSHRQREEETGKKKDAYPCHYDSP